MWPSTSDVQCFATRRQKLLQACAFPCALGSGVARVRNFEANRFPFRAESHFLYFVGRHLEGSILLFDDGRVTLFAPEPTAEDALWHGPQPSLEELGVQLGLEVVSIAEFSAPEEVATIAPNDLESALWLEEHLGRIVDPGSSDEMLEADAQLANVVIAQRLRQDAGALAQMRYAQKVTAAAHLAGLRATVVGHPEAVVRAAIEAEFAKAGLINAYSPIVSVQGQVLHNETSSNLMQDGDLLLVDAGAESVEGFAADVTRTWPVSGKFSPLQASLYDAVLASQEAAISALRPGVRFRDVHRLAARTLLQQLVALGLFRGSEDELIAAGAHAVFFPHGLGHLLGLDVHDMEDLGDRAGYAEGRERSGEPGEVFLRLDRDLEAGMVVTIEPGFYVIPQQIERCSTELKRCLNVALLEQVQAELRGIRIEDDVLITDDGYEVLSAAVPKGRTELEAALGG